MTAKDTMTTTNSLDLARSAFPIFGGTAPYGISVTADVLPRTGVLVSRLSDGTDLNAIWTELQDVFDVWNKERVGVVQLLSYPTILAAEAVPQSIQSASFEQATELGVPRSAATPATAGVLGFDFIDWDNRISTSARFLRDADRRQVEGIFNSVLHSDNRLTTGRILRRLLDPTPRTTPEGATARGLYTGDDNWTPPPYIGNVFPANTSHYWKSGASVIDSTDIESAYRAIRDKGYGLGNGSQLLIIAHPNESEVIQTWESGRESRPKEGAELNGPLARHDYVPAKTAPAFMTPDNIVGQQISGDFNGVEVLGNYGPGWLLETPFMVPGYVLVAASSGVNSTNNIVGFREHVLPEHRNLRLIPGNQLGYPLVDSFALRSFGVGVRHRGGAVAIQVGATGSYTKPANADIPI